MTAVINAPDAATFRRSFPALEDTVHLASCSMGARSLDMDRAMARMLEAMARLGAPWREFEDQLSEARQRFAALIGARPEQIAVVPNVSVGAYQVASTRQWDRRPKLVATTAEFPSVAHVWLAQRQCGAEVVTVDGRDGAVRAEDLASAVDGRTGLVSVPLVTYRDGVRLPIAEVVDAARAVGAPVFVDAYQAIGVEPVNVDELGCDYLVAGAMKYLLGLPGVAFLYVRSTDATDRPPQLTGSMARIDPFAFDPLTLDFPEEARRFETGTPAVPALYAANAGLGLIEALDLHAVRRHVSELVAYAAMRLTEQGETVRMAAEAAARGAHIGLVDPQPEALGRFLAERQIVVSPRGDSVRLSFHYYNGTDDIDAACGQIRTYRESRACRRDPRSGPGRDDMPCEPAGGKLAAWSSVPDATTFPYDALMAEYLSRGKHFVPGEILDALGDVRSGFQRIRGSRGEKKRLEDFLDTALDKHDGRYEYTTYLALGLLALPGEQDVPIDVASAELRHDRLFAQLIGDALRFELDALDHATGLLPEMRPDARTTQKRLKLGLNAIGPALRRLDLRVDASADDPASVARQACDAVAGGQSRSDRLRLQLSMLPVFVVHDEYLFIRVLQSFETAFAWVAVHLRASLPAFAGRPAEVVRRLDRANGMLGEAARLFPLLATMQTESFRTFRVYTEGASAIQSRNYKTIESLCRMPDRSRLDSIAYHSVPEVRERLLAGQATLDDAFRSACESGLLASAQREALTAAMERFAKTLRQWRQTHYRLAVRLLGERPGTGYTEGTPYLKAVRTIPVFRHTGREGS